MNEKERLFRAQAEKIFKEKQEFDDAVEDILKVQNLGFDYASFDTANELILYLQGREIPEFDEPIHITRVQKTALRKLFKRR